MDYKKEKIIMKSIIKVQRLSKAYLKRNILEKS